MRTYIKLKDRAQRIVSSIANIEKEKAKTTLESNSYKVKEAILQLKYSISFDEASKLLNENNGILRKVFKLLDT